MKLLILPVLALSAAFVVTPTAGLAWDHDDEDEIPFGEARLFFELNDTDGDLGIHGKIDGDEWRRIEIEDPHERRMMTVRASGRLKRQGLTELFFESAEPTFDDLDPIDFFNRFPEGWYEIEGLTLDFEERESEVYLSHVMPAAPGPEGTEVNGEVAAEDCDADLEIVDPAGGVTIDWDPVEYAHDDLGTHTGEMLSSIGDGISVLYYEVVIEIDESNFKASTFVPADVTEWTFSEDFFELAEEGVLESNDEMDCDEPVTGDKCLAEYKYEILVRTNIIDENGDVVEADIWEDGEVVGEVVVPGNKSAMESCFLVEIK
jgi:hypothetical protein